MQKQAVGGKHSMMSSLEKQHFHHVFLQWLWL